MLTHRSTLALTSLLAGAALTVACTNPFQLKRSHSDPSTLGHPPITVDAARELLTSITRQNNDANARRDSKLLAEYESESSLDMDDAYFRVQRSLDPTNSKPSKPFTYTDRKSVV